MHDWPDAVKQDFIKLYAIARRNSKVTAQQFERFCREIGAKIQRADPALRALFEPRLIEDVFLVEEYAFDATKQEIAEMALVQVPPTLEGSGITVMDGPFFSMMPFPPRGLHTLSHVRYTPHLYWTDEQGIDPYQKLKLYGRATRVDRMLRDVARYLPAVRDAKYVDSLFEVKTVLVKNENDDGRPILFEKHPELPGCFSVLGGKIDNIYDVLDKLDAEVF